MVEEGKSGSRALTYRKASKVKLSQHRGEMRR